MIEEVLSQLVSFKTVTTDKKTCRQALEWIAKRPELKALEKRWFEQGGSPSLLMTTKRTKTPALWLVAHVDVVEAEEHQFTLQKEGDKLIGRGVYDMLFAIAAFVRAVTLLSKDVSKYDFGIMLTSDEETGGRNGVGSLLEAGYASKVAIVPDGGKNWELITSVKGVYQVELSVRGVAAHSSRPWEGDNPIPRLLEQLLKIQEWFIATFPDPKQSTSCVVTVVEAGTSVNRVPESALARLDIRYKTKAELSRVKAFLESLEIEMSEIGFGSEVDIPQDNRYVQSFKEIAAQHGITMEVGQQFGSNDGRYFAAKNISPIIFRPNGGGHHGNKEWVSLSDVEIMAKILANYIQQVGPIS